VPRAFPLRPRRAIPLALTSAEEAADMKGAGTCVALLLIAGGLARADDLASHGYQVTTAMSLARFEIVQSSLAAEWVFRLDRYSGRVWKLVKTNDDDGRWEEMQVIGLPRGQFVEKPHFQVFTSGVAVRHTFLIDNDTGKTWVVTVEKPADGNAATGDVVVWQPVAETQR
jgi:hypothetical protein